ncbi:Ig-like domain-containing protein [Pimelobacter simplex]|uniref:Fibronectin, type III domain protein n=4 Tax=Nocardioides simplex TaxID=2045 RepID=A0A0A1DNR6_NOCSI|nr:Ig-like domain-containing protein [Pimelobacter simplex]AIY17005.1 Fibronectin, type III domain protein [Pimelobacter simplex]GEB12929.1 fibronectin type III [Pimelobacter simplex]SFM52106.1 Fibronectin type III domain-containing protein [Pimelobacter simplex]
MIRRWRRTASATALALLLGTLVVLAFEHDGKPFTEVDLNDGGVWVTNQEKGLVARLNPQIEELDLGVDSGSTTFDIFQRDTSLYVDDASSERAVKPVDVARAAVLDPTALPTGAVVAQGGDTFAIVDPGGKAWVRSGEGLRGFTVKAAKPDVTGALSAVVGTDGRAYVLGRDGKVTPVSTDDAGLPVTEDRMKLGSDVGTEPGNVDLTVVGDTPVLYNRSTLELSRPDADPVVVEAADPTAVALQQPSGESGEVYVATQNGLYSVPLEGGKLDKVSRGDVDGRPAAPVAMTSTRCVYAAWADPDSSGNYLRDCADDADDDTAPVPEMEDGAELEFRVNRDVVVLNDTRTGDSWLVQDPGKAKIDNWPAVDPNNQNRSKIKETTDEVPDQENRPPVPEDDDLGARRGRTTVFPVVALNDHDPDGDIISIAKVTQQSGEPMEVRIVGGGTQLQVNVPADAEGKAVFRYAVTDGKVNDLAYAELRVQVRTDEQHSRPKLMPDREPVLTVARGATSDYYLLADYYDPDGDDLTLREATARGGDVEFRPDGTITFTDDGSGSKVSEIQYTIEDGQDTITDKLRVQVVGDTAPPELVPDLASGVADTQVVVQPLTNDRNPEGNDLKLKGVKVVGDDTGTSITRDLDNGTFTFQATKARSYYLEYTAYNSSATRSSFIRLDIESPPKDNRAPIAVRDKAVITPGGSAQVDLLLNDFDPDGDVLVVKRVGRPSVAGVKVSVVDKRLAVVSTTTDIVGQQATVEYVVSDGRSSTVGQLVIAQREASQVNRHPVANKDQVTVRAGAVTTIPVLANDSDPDGGKPRLFQSDLDAGDLNVWVAGDVLRLRAPDKPGTYSVIYGVRDTDGLKATAEVSIFVIPDSAKNNHPPLPEPIIDRVISGRPKVISVDLAGADPDGDSVAFRSILTAPKLGRVLDTGVDWLRYEAFEDKAGTDFFQVQVQDKYGETGVAEVRVGVVPEEAENQPPVALDDNVLVQPNRTISYNVLTNDVDPDDDPLRIAELNSTTKAKHRNGFVELDVGDAPDAGAAATNIGYTIEDAAGAEGHAVLKVSASHDAPFYAPIARDDVADLGDIIGRDPGAWVDIPVLENDLDFDGPKVELKVTDCDAGSRGECEVAKGDSTVRVKLTADDQVVLYRLDDSDDESSDTFGVIYVTGTANVPPQLTTAKDKIPVKAVSGERVVLDLEDLVVTRAGREPRIVPDRTPTAVNGVVGAVEGSPTSLSFVSDRGHVGPASVTVSVSDGRTTGEDAGLTSLLTIPIDVRPSGNVAPEMRDAAVDVGTEGDAAQVDLAGLTRDANEDDLDTMAYSVKSAEAGLTASIPSGESILSIEASGGAKDGDTLKVAVVADDGHGGTTEATVTAHIVDSDRPRLEIPVISVTTKKGEVRSVDLADYAVNPYPGEPIKASNARIEGSGRVDDLETDGSSVSFRPVGSGTSTIKVTVSDASDDKKRDVTARINVVVLDVPAAPPRPALSSVEASSAVLSWREPDANGAPIEQYEVSGSHGFRQICTGPTCRLDDLTPGETYTFTVKAENSVGWSEASPPSEAITPNKAPDLMSPPTIVVEPKPTGSRMDRQLTVRWTPPANEGSPITSYEIKEAGSGRTWTATGGQTSHLITGLDNGTSYAFEIRAVNDVEPRRQFSGASQSVAPFGVPVRSGAPPQLTASEDSPYTNEPWVRIDWSRWSVSQSNGNAVSAYVITCDGCSRSTYTVGAGTSSKTFGAGDGIRKGQTVTFTVAATNDAGTSDRSPSVSGRPWTKAGPVRGLREVGSSPSDRTAMIGWDAPADDGGLPIRYYVVQTGSSGSVTVPAAPGGGGQAITFADNGTHSIRVWAVTFNGDRSVEGQADSLDGILTWGKPFPPDDTSKTSTEYYSVDLRLQAGAANGKPVTGVQFSTDGGASWNDRRSGESWSTAVEQGGSTARIMVRTRSSATGDREFSDPITITGTSKEKYLAISVSCNVLGRCAIGVNADGFINQPRDAVVSLNGLQPYGDSCGSFTQSVSGRLSYTAGGNGCRVTGDAKPSVTLDGVSRTAP